MTYVALFGFLLVFVRCSALFLTSPVFGAQNTPVHIRVLTTLAVSAALTFTLRPDMGQVPASLYGLVGALVREAFAGILIGSFVSFAMQTLSVAGSLMDLQTGLSSSHAINPISGGQSTLISQFKTMLGIVIFLCADFHHVLIGAFVQSYKVIPSVGAVEQSLVGLIGRIFLIGVQIAAPVMGVGFLVDAALGLLSRAVPQVQAMHVGLPAKIGAGLATIALGLPVTVVGVKVAVAASMLALKPLFHFHA